MKQSTCKTRSVTTGGVFIAWANIAYCNWRREDERIIARRLVFMQPRLLVVFLLALSLLWMVARVDAQMTSVDITGGTSNISNGMKGTVYAFPIHITFPSLVTAIGVNLAGALQSDVAVALYSNNYTGGSNRPYRLLTDSGTIFITTSGGWQDIPVAIKSLTNSGEYWVAIQLTAGASVYAVASTRAYYPKEFGPFNPSWPDSNYTLDYADQWNMHVISTVTFPILQQQQNPINPYSTSYANYIGTCDRPVHSIILAATHQLPTCNR